MTNVVVTNAEDGREKWICLFLLTEEQSVVVDSAEEEYEVKKKAGCGSPTTPREAYIYKHLHK